MAKGIPPVKSQAIRDFLAVNKNAMPQQIVDALKQKGIDVSFGLAKGIKYSKPKKKASAKSLSRPTVAVKSPFVSASESIRQFIAKNPKAGPKGIQAGLKADGVIVKLGLISAVKYSKRHKLARRRSKTLVAHSVARSLSSSAPTFEQLVQVKEIADSMGGTDQVRAALDALAQLQ